MDQFEINLPQRTESKIMNQLRQEGYLNNYVLAAGRSLICIDDNSCIGYDLATVWLVDHILDEFMKPGALVFIVETINGGKGIMTLSLNDKKKRRCRHSSADMIEGFWNAL